MPSIKPEDIGHFSTLLNEVDESKMTVEEVRDRKIMVLLLKVIMLIIFRSKTELLQ